MTTEYTKQLLSNDAAQGYTVFPSAPVAVPAPVSTKAGCTKIRFDRHGHRIMDFFTDYGVQRVSIDGDLNSGRPVIMTYHDIGINHNGCFLSFFNMMRAYDAKFRYFTIVHIDAPGHHSVDANSSNNGSATATTASNSPPKCDAFDLSELSNQVEEIRSALGVDRFIAFAVGAGCSVFTHYALNFGQRLRGSVLINGVASGISWKEWVFDSLLSTMGHDNSYLVSTFQGSLLARYFPASNVSSEVYDYFEQQFSNMDHLSAIRYFRGFVQRKELNAELLHKIKTKTLVICGEFSKVKEETVEFQKLMPRQYTHFMLMSRGGFLLTESSPQKLAKSFDFFVQSLGITTISMQKKFGKLEDPNQIA